MITERKQTVSKMRHYRSQAKWKYLGFVLTLLGFSSASKEKKKKISQEKIATLTEQKEKNNLTKINFTSNPLDRDFKQPIFIYCMFCKTIV